MNNPKVSVIIPVYNKENYLSRCIDSIIKQTFTNFECILIDDGSSDNSKVICNEYEKKDSRFKYYYQENAGPAEARYNGVNRSLSDMIMFVDADDWIGDTIIEILYNEYLKTKADIIFNTITNEVLNNNSLLKKSKSINNQLPLCYYFEPSVEKGSYNKLINKILWENIYLPGKSRYEDFITGVQMFSKIKANNISCITVPNVYFYSKDSNNNLSSASKDYFNKPYKEIKDIFIFEWIENFILSFKTENKNELEAAYSLFFMNTIVFPYILKSNYVTKEEIANFFNYYKKAVSYGKFSFLRNIYINIFYRSFNFGKLFQKYVLKIRK